MSSEANKALDEAIRAVTVEEEWTGVITGYIVLVGYVDMDGGEEGSGVGILYPDGSLPWPTALGLIEAARLRIRHQYLHRPDDD